MAIIKVSQFNSAPTAVSDYEAQNAHIMAFINQVNSQAFILTNPTGTTEPTIKQDTYINHGGTLYTVDTADESITGSPADGNVYIKLSVSGDNLIASYVTDISSYTWNQVYGYLASGTDIILPYLLVKSGTSWTKYRMDIKTPQYVTDQNLRTTDAVDFASVNTGQGDNELYAMNQAVRTTDDVEFTSLDIEYGQVYSLGRFGLYSTTNPFIAGVGLLRVSTNRSIDGANYKQNTIIRAVGGSAYSYDLTIKNVWVFKDGQVPYIVRSTPEVITVPASDPNTEYILIPAMDY
jgi:hypothetical protein